MMQNRNTHKAIILTGMALVILVTISLDRAIALENNPPARCAGYGNLQSISLTDWEAGLGSWTVGTHDVANPNTFGTLDWEVVGSLPDSRSGQAAFVANLDSDCGGDDGTGALTLDSPPIVIPVGIQVPRISIDHWFATELGWDGGNFKISVNGGAFNLIPASAIEIGPYNDTLFPALDEFGTDFNTNPLADQDAFTGTYDGQPTGSWIQSRINLLGIAAAGDTIELRFDFGIDACGGDIGWYVDEVEFYSCEAELPPSDCGNGVIDQGEQCDDGNSFIGDGCSNTCQIEDGWQCAAPTLPGTISDPSFEAGTPNPSWAEVSNNTIGTPICEAAVCGTGGGSGPSEGSFWVWLGGTTQMQEGSVSQSVVIPSTVTDLTFDLEVPTCDSASDYIEVLIDGARELLINGSSPLCGIDGYSTQSVDISAYADDGTHDLEFHSETFSDNGAVSNFFIDVISMPGNPSVCTQGNDTSLTLVKKVTNNNGGSATPANWTLTAIGPTGFSGPGPSVSNGAGFEAGSYDLSESGGPAGYAASDWVCTGGTQNAKTITLALGEAATCTITNDDMTPTLRVVKTIINDNGGTVTNPNAFGLKVDGGSVLHNAINAFDAGNHTVSEDGLAGYQPGTWGGDCNPDGSITLVLGEAAACTITNDDDIGSAFQINAGHAGAWFNPDTSGQGQLIDVEPEGQYMFVSWFTYTDAASDNPFEQRWLTAQGNYSGNTAELDLWETLGGRFDDPQEVTNTPIGEVTLSFTDCGQGQMSYSFDEEGLQGEFPLIRVIPGSGNVCDELSGNTTQAVDINAGMDGAWFDLNTSGQGFFIDAHPDPEGGNFIFVAWFTYGEDTASGLRWLTAEGGFEGSIAEIDVYEVTGGSFDDPQPISRVNVGTMSIDFTDCNHALLTYSLTDNGAEGDIEVTRVIPEGKALCEELAGAE